MPRAPKPPSKPSDRRARAAEALRANLRRRKAAGHDEDPKPSGRS